MPRSRKLGRVQLLPLANGVYELIGYLNEVNVTLSPKTITTPRCTTGMVKIVGDVAIIDMILGKIDKGHMEEFERVLWGHGVRKMEWERLSQRGTKSVTRTIKSVKN